ncbi:putative permease-like protein [Trypanosoma cruzi]|uniref:Permease-like protein, putative n=2 Tax=Trypanosoma cruzi TaxID=5693 RepID=Q4DQX5_TRYCC|nr:permease-like protein, putative [Trypanosoma cruzi]EAN94932.1 permease-like protein, putative [Trypanosoma cruzi]PWV16779.1 putative permease-like protein [Trypanosoma cruzi]RNC46639.1 permease-like protein [Trypanosoma cruzi]|eukprot:XP_816783.1 permease-like protein [Trypanosoma cruzi strain CL Brener]
MRNALYAPFNDTQNSSDTSRPDTRLIRQHPNNSRRLHDSPSEPFFSGSFREKSGLSGRGFFSLCAILRLSCLYTISDLIHRPRNCCIGVLAVVLLVLFSGAVLLGIWKVPYVLLRLGELSAGEMDMVIMGGSVDLPFINYTDMGPRLERSPYVKGATPRWIFRGEASKHKNVFTNDNDSVSPLTEVARVNVLLIDSERERKIGIGRDWGHRNTGFSEAHVFYSLLDYLNVRPNLGDRINIQFSPKPLLQDDMRSENETLFRIEKPTPRSDVNSILLYNFFQTNGITEKSISVWDVLNFDISVSVVDGIYSARGKYPSALGNIVIVDYKQLIPAFAEQSCSFGPQSFTPKRGIFLPSTMDMFGIPTMLSQFNILEKVPTLAVTMTDRSNIYYLPTEDRTKEMVERSNVIMRQGVGLDFNGTVYFPLSEAMDSFDMLKIILVSSLTCFVIGIVALCALLFYALLNTNAEERRFEFAMIRAQGLNKTHLVILLLTQSLAFIIPGLATGGAFLVGLNALIESLLSRFTAATPRILFVPLIPLFLSLGLGLVLPLLTGWGLLSRVLGGSLRDALDVYRQVSNETKVVMVKLEEMGISTWQLILGAFLVVAGFIVYYLIPFSFIFENMMLLFLLLNLVLVVMVVGICFIVTVAEPYIQLVFLWLMVWGNEKRLLTIVKKNLYDHQSRNAKAFMMVLISVGTIISSGVMFVMLSNASEDMTRLTNGADINIASSAFDVPLDERELNAFLEKRRGLYVEQWAYHSFPLDNYPQMVHSSRIGTIIGTRNPMCIVAVSEHFFNTVFPEYIMEEAKDSRYSYKLTVDGKYDLVRSMYERKPLPSGTVGQIIGTGLPFGVELPNILNKKTYIIPALVSSAVRDSMGTEVGGSMILEYNYRVSDTIVTTRFGIEPRGLMRRVSGFPDISPFPNKLIDSEVLLPRSYFKTLVKPWAMDFGDNENFTLAPGTVTEVRQKKLFVRLRKNISTKQRITFLNEIQAHLDLTFHSASDTHEMLKDLRVIREFIMYFFYFTSVICISLCTLMLWITFVANVRLNSRTFMVLRAVGCRKGQIARIILYEALSIVLSAFLLGVVVGAIVGVTLALQLVEVMVLPFRFTLPYELVCVLFGLSMIAAVVGSMLPFRTIANKCISSGLRSL